MRDEEADEEDEAEDREVKEVVSIGTVVPGSGDVGNWRRLGIVTRLSDGWAGAFEGECSELLDVGWSF